MYSQHNVSVIDEGAVEFKRFNIQLVFPKVRFDKTFSGNGTVIPKEIHTQSMYLYTENLATLSHRL